MSSSESSESELNKIKEAVDTNFLTEDLYGEYECKKKAVNSLITTSFRNQNYQNVSVNPLSVKVTCEFQSHVSKHLSRILDEIIDDTQVFSNKKPNIGHLNCGIKLLYSSKAYLEVANKNNTAVKPKKFIKKKHFSSSVYEKRAKEVAVTPEWVLSQEETKYWASNTRGKIEIIKLKTDDIE